MGLHARVFSLTGQVYEVIAVYPDLAALDKSRKARASATRETVSKLHQVSRDPIRQRVFEVLVPFPS